MHEKIHEPSGRFQTKEKLDVPSSLPLLDTEDTLPKEIERHLLEEKTEDAKILEDYHQMSLHQSREKMRGETEETGTLPTRAVRDQIRVNAPVVCTIATGSEGCGPRTVTSLEPEAITSQDKTDSMPPPIESSSTQPREPSLALHHASWLDPISQCSTCAHATVMPDDRAIETSHAFESSDITASTSFIFDQQPGTIVLLPLEQNMTEETPTIPSAGSVEATRLKRSDVIMEARSIDETKENTTIPQTSSLAVQPGAASNVSNAAAHNARGRSSPHEQYNDVITSRTSMEFTLWLYFSLICHRVEHRGCPVGFRPRKA
jgi:hypothetical protein